MISLVDVDEFQGFLGYESFTPGEAAQAAQFLTGASALVRSYAGATFVTDDELDDDIPDGILIATKQVAARVFRNPEGFVRENAGQWGGDLGPDAAQGFYLTDSEKAMISDAVSSTDGTPTGLWALGTTRGDYLETSKCYERVWSSPVEEYDPFGEGMPR